MLGPDWGCTVEARLMVGLPGVCGTADERAFLEGAGAMEKWPSLPEMSPEAERGRSTLISPFLSPPIFPSASH